MAEGYHGEPGPERIAPKPERVRVASFDGGDSDDVSAVYLTPSNIYPGSYQLECEYTDGTLNRVVDLHATMDEMAVIATGILDRSLKEKLDGR